MPGNLIEELTEEQLALLDVWRDKWKDVGYSTEPADRPAAESAINTVYENTNRVRPHIIWCGSPMAMAEARATYNQQTTDESVNSIIVDIWSDPMSPSIMDYFSQEVRTRVAARLHRDVWGRVGDLVWWSVRRCAGIVFGQHSSDSLAVLDYFKQVVGLPSEFDPLVDMIDVAKAAGWWIPQENICWVSERPSSMHRDDLGRLHNISGPALQYPDGWSIYAVGGVLVPAEFVEDRATIDPTRAITEPNAEHRQALIQILGWDRVLDHVTLSKVSEDGYGTLFETPLFADDGDLPARFVQVRCTTTGRTYQFRVPPDCTTPRHALGWKYHPSRPVMGHDVDPLWYSPDAES